MESIVTRVTSKGQVVIPKQLRQKYAIVPTTLIRWIDKEDGMLMVPETRDPILAVRGMLQGSGLLKAFKEAKAEENERENKNAARRKSVCAG
ncbi:MAG: AbrB/MazE/SpoVT family DNA-binding domain-containing protein [Deltaproteobacteria bacterium]|nr:AbrB/MazE/SpoVT family DNA-binding domain-containing protein [Deltaproteobacteria bacterium]